VKLSKALTLLIAVSLSFGCALTPDYEAPDLSEPTTFVQPVDAGESIANVDWFEIFVDPELVIHIQTALDQNRERAVALARIAEARQLVTIVRAGRFPFLNFGASATRGLQSTSIVPGAVESNEFEIAAGMVFELDIWQRFARSNEAALADLLATEAGYRSITIRIVADVAATYFFLLDLDARLQIAKNTVENHTGSLTIVEARFDQGVVPLIDVNRAEVQLAFAEASVAALERDVLQTQNALRVLLGGFPGPVARGNPLVDWEATRQVPTGLPADLLQRRPDLVAAERILAAETARIGVAEALRWPSISLTGTIGLASDELSGLNSSDAKIWDVGADIFSPIFNSGRLKAQAEAQRARAEQALFIYEGAARQAFREVEDALIAVRTYRVELAALTRQVNATQNVARLSQARYVSGTVGFLEVLDAERDFFGAQLAESAARQGAIVSLVRLYEALGGGWVIDQ